MEEIIKTYENVKAKYQEPVVLVRCKDFYYTFFDDATKTADVVRGRVQKQTRKTMIQGEDIIYFSFPSHALDVYLPKMIRSGLRVAICDMDFNNEKKLRR